MSARSPRRVVVAIALLALAGAGIAIVRGRAAHAPAVSAVEGPPSRTVSRAAAGVRGPARDPRPVPWETGLVAGGFDAHTEDYDDGIEPNNTNKSGTFLITISQLPAVASGVSTISKDIGLFGNECI